MYRVLVRPTVGPVFRAQKKGALSGPLSCVPCSGGELLQRLADRVGDLGVTGGPEARGQIPPHDRQRGQRQVRVAHRHLHVLHDGGRGADRRRRRRRQLGGERLVHVGGLAGGLVGGGDGLL